MPRHPAGEMAIVCDDCYGEIVAAQGRTAERGPES
jgi:hypothetical protein